MDLIDIEDDVQAFLIESNENLAEIERDILEYEKNPNNSDLIIKVYRCIHTLKGNSSFLPFSKLEALAHASESLLGGLRDRKIPVTPETIGVLLQAVDAIRAMLNQIEAAGAEGEETYSSLIERLNQLQTPQKEATVSAPAIEKLYSLPEVTVDRTSETGLSDVSIRVNVTVLDRLMNLVGELVLARNQILQIAAAQENTALTATCQRLNLISTDLQSEVMKTRMQPISTLLQKFPRVTRDLALACNKQVQVTMEGGETELDKTLIEAIKDPLTHLVRNCIDHGIELPSVRTAQGKSPQGQLWLRAYHQSGKVNLEIADDGAGIDPKHLKQQAQEHGLISATQLAEMSDAEALNLIFLSGFSTAAKVTHLSGRGVGMDVVKTNIEKINGTVEIESVLGKGTTFKIQIPLTLAILPALMITSKGAAYAIPQESILELVRLEGEERIAQIETLYDVPVYRLRGKILPLVDLNQQLQLETQASDRETLNIVVLQADSYRLGLIVDEVHDTQEIVVKPLGQQLKMLSTFAGATILGDGKVALILDVIGLADRAGILSEQSKDKLNSKASVAVETTHSDRQMLVIFEGPDGQMAIPIAVAARLEQLPSSAVQKSGNRYLVPYRDRLLPLVFLSTFLANDSALRATDAPVAEEEMLSVVVVSLDEENSAGLVVEKILDIVEEELTIKGTAFREGVLFTALIQDRVTEVLDVEMLVRMVNPLQCSGARITDE